MIALGFLISFFKDYVDGVWYFLFILLCIFFIFVLLGIVGDRKRRAIADMLKEKRSYDIASGKVARIAAMESKQILDVMEETPNDLSSENKNSLVGGEASPLLDTNGTSNSSGVTLNSTPVINPNSGTFASSNSTNFQNSTGLLTQQPSEGQVSPLNSDDSNSVPTGPLLIESESINNK